MMPERGASPSPRGPTVTFENVVTALRVLGITSGDIVMVHSSLSSVGYVEGGADSVIDAFLSVLGPEGTLCVPTIIPTGKGPRPPFDVKTSPSEVGVISETLRRRPDAFRSNNATHSVAAIGARAKGLTNGHERVGGRPSPWGEFAFGIESPWQKLYDLNAKYVLFGVDWNVNTMFHYVQARFVEPYGSEFATPAPFPYFDMRQMGQELQDARIVRRLQLGTAVIKCVETRAMVDTALSTLRENPGRFFANGDRHDFVRWYRRIPTRRRRLRAGAAKLPITPPPDLTSEARVLEPTHVRALALEYGELSAAIVVCDLIGLVRRHVAAARQSVEERAGIQAANVMISCTHTHAGPHTLPPLDDRTESYCASVADRIADAVAMARAHIQEVRVGVGRRVLEGIAQNRRMRLTDGTASPCVARSPPRGAYSRLAISRPAR